MSRIKKKVACIFMCAVALFTQVGATVPASADVYDVPEESYIVNSRDEETIDRNDTMVEVSKFSDETLSDAEENIVNYYMAEEDINLIALITMAEAEGECEEGKRLVIDTILNRVDSTHFPNTVSEVIYQPNQFECAWNGRIDRCEVKTDIRELVIEELNNRTNSEVVFFTAGNYSAYGVPLFSVEHHYFSKYE